MAVSSRWDRTGTVSKPTTTGAWVTDGAGGRKKATPKTTVVTSFTYMRWLPSPFQVATLQTMYGLKTSASLFNFQGEWNADIEEGHIIAEDTTGLYFRIHGVRQHKRGTAAASGSHLSGVLEQLEGAGLQTGS